MELSGRIALVTGGSSGIGAACARLLAAAGADIAVNFRTSRESAEQVTLNIAQQGGRALAVQADVTSAAEVSQMIETVCDELGPIDILINNAGGVIARTPVWECSESLWDGVIALNLKSVFLCSRAVLPSMIARGRGSIVNITSYASRSGGAGIGSIPYAAAKAAVETMTVGMARDLAANGIRINAVAPGLVDTPLHGRTQIAERYGTAEQLYTAVERATPMKRAATAEEVARSALFLASDAASYVTGQVLYVTGGL